MAGTRYLVRRTTKEVFIWTEALAKGHSDLEEVIADSPAQAIDKKALPDPRSISIAEIESMSKKELIEFAKLRLGLELDAGEKLPTLQGEVKVAIFTSGSGSIETVEVDMRTASPGEAITQTTPQPNARAARARRGA